MNHHHGKQTDRMNSQLAASADVVRHGVLEEMARAEGVFVTHLLRPDPRAMNEFMPLWDRRNMLERRLQQRIVRFVPGLVGWMLDEIESLKERMLPLQYCAWEDTFHNTVATVGKNLALDTFLAGSSYTVVGPYMGLISSASYSAISAADTMSSHGGWLEAGNANAPTYTSPRKTAAWSSASAGAKALSSALSFAITGTGTVKGCFVVYGSGAVTTIDNTSGTLLSAGLFTGGDKAVVNTDTLNVSYSLAL